LAFEFDKNLASQIYPKWAIFHSILYQLQALLFTHANRACTCQFATPEVGVTGVLRRKYRWIQAKFLALGKT
jgi:hypothetical protein